MKKHMIPLFILVVSIAISIIAYPHLPDQVPVHWNAHGEVNRYAGKLFAVSIMPIIIAGMYLLFTVLPKIDPKKANYPKFTDSYRIMIYSIMGFMLVIQVITTLIPLGYDIDINGVVPILIGILFIIMGNYMQRAKQNFFMGIRNPWTLSSEVVWKKTHRLVSKIFVVVGICMALGAFLPADFQPFIMIGSVVIILLASYLAAYIFYKQEQQE